MISLQEETCTSRATILMNLSKKYMSDLSIKEFLCFQRLENVEIYTIKKINTFGFKKKILYSLSTSQIHLIVVTG